MPDSPDSDVKDVPKEPPAPEVLQAQTDDGSVVTAEGDALPVAHKSIRLRRNTYRPSHRATFVGLAVVVVILLANAGILGYLMITQQNNTNSSTKSQGEVTISSAVLDTLGVSRNTVGNSGTLLVVNPDSNFNGKLKVAGDTSIAGQLRLNSKLIGTDATLGKLDAGDATMGQINVSGNGTISNLNLRNNLIVVGSTQLQGAVTISQLLTVNNSLNISGNLSVGGTLSISAFQVNILTIGGHVISRGSAPSVSPGSISVLGSNGTVTISGNDASGTVAANTGVGTRTAGIVAYVNFVNPYTNIPHVMVTAVGGGATGVYVNRSETGFSICVNDPLSLGGHAFDYIVMQ